MADTAETPVVDNPTAGRFELRVGDQVAELVYNQQGDRLVLIHTGVPDELGGRGLGGKLVRAALTKAREGNLAIDPACPFAREWLRKHPDEHEGIVIVESGAR